MGYFTKSISKAKEYQSTELKNLYKFKDIASKLYTYFLNFHTLCWCQQVMATIVYSAWFFSSLITAIRSIVLKNSR